MRARSVDRAQGPPPAAPRPLGDPRRDRPARSRWPSSSASLFGVGDRASTRRSVRRRRPRRRRRSREAFAPTCSGRSSAACVDGRRSAPPARRARWPTAATVDAAFVDPGGVQRGGRGGRRRELDVIGNVDSAPGPDVATSIARSFAARLDVSAVRAPRARGRPSAGADDRRRPTAPTARRAQAARRRRSWSTSAAAATSSCTSRRSSRPGWRCSSCSSPSSSAFAACSTSARRARSPGCSPRRSRRWRSSPARRSPRRSSAWSA